MKLPVINFLLPFILGIVLQTFLGLSFIPLIICFFICLVLSFSLEKLANLFLIFTIFLFGALLLQNAKQPLTKNHIANFLDTNTKLVLQAEVVSCSQDYAKGKKFEILAQKLKLDAKEIEVSGKLLLSLKDFPNKKMIDYGDKIEFEAKLFSPKDKRNPGEFDYKAYLENRKIYGIATLYQTKQLKILSREGGNFWWKDVVYPTRKVIKNIFETYASKETAGILIGMFLGDKTELSQQIKEDFANSGIVHLLAVSGLNVGFIAFLLFTLLSFFRVKGFAGFIVLTFCLVLYCFLTDLTASVLRASLMLFLFLLSKQSERKTDGLNTLALAAVLILIFDPLQLYDVGFQLSFGAMLGILALQPIIFTAFTQKFPVLLTETKLGKSLNWIVQLGLASFTASLGTLPQILFYFAKFPLGGFFANFFAIPLSGIVLYLAFVILLFSPVPFLAQLYSNACEIFVWLLLEVAHFFGKFDFTIVRFGRLNGFELLLGFALPLVVYFFFKTKGKMRLTIFLSTFLVFSSYGIFRSFKSQKNFKVTFIDIGQGDASLWQFPNGETWLCDAGNKTSDFDCGEKIILPLLSYYKIDTLDAVLVSHPHADHFGGMLKILEKIPAKKIYDSGQFYESEFYENYLKIIEQKKIPRKRPLVNEKMRVGESEIVFLHPDNNFVTENQASNFGLNNGSLVCKVSFGEIDFLFVGDCEKEADNALAENFGKKLEAEVLKVGHHGSITSSSQKFVLNVKPKFAIIQVGKFNKFNHPSDLVLNRYKVLGTEVFRNDLEGAIVLESDGKNVWKSDWKKFSWF